MATLLSYKLFFSHLYFLAGLVGIVNLSLTALFLEHYTFQVHSYGQHVLLIGRAVVCSEILLTRGLGLGITCSLENSEISAFLLVLLGSYLY